MIESVFAKLNRQLLIDSLIDPLGFCYSMDQSRVVGKLIFETVAI